MIALLSALWHMIINTGYLTWAVGVVLMVLAYRMTPHKTNQDYFQVFSVFFSGAVAFFIGWHTSMPLMFLLASFFTIGLGIVRLNEELDARKGKQILPKAEWQARDDDFHRKARENFINYRPVKQANNGPKEETPAE